MILVYEVLFAELVELQLPLQWLSPLALSVSGDPRPTASGSKRLLVEYELIQVLGFIPSAIVRCPV
jgi:hypothetical protein